MEVYRFSLVIGRNITIFDQTSTGSAFRRKYMFIPGCRKSVPVRGVSQPRIHIIPVKRFQELGDFGIVTYSRRLSFLSCHAERSSWIINLKEISQRG